MKKLSVLVVAMMVGSMALATGCNKASDASAPESARSSNLKVVAIRSRETEERGTVRCIAWLG